MYISLRIKIWILLLIPISGLAYFLHQSSSDQIRNDFREVYQTRLTGMFKGVAAYWEKDQNELLQAANLYAESDKIINFSIYGLHNLLHQELRRLLSNSGFQELEIKLKSGLRISGRSEQFKNEDPFNLADPRLNLSKLTLSSKNHLLEMIAEVPVTKMGEFVGRLILVKRWDAGNLSQMSGVIQAHLAIAVRSEVLATTLNAEQKKDLTSLIYQKADSLTRIFEPELNGKIYWAAVVEVGETLERDPVRVFCVISQRKMLSMIEEARSRTLNLSLMALAISFFLAVFFSEKVLTKRIHQIRDGSYLLAQEQLSFRLPTYWRDELGDLARAFNDMAGKLQDNHNKLFIQYEELQMYIGSLENMKTYIQNILGSLSTGVITWNKAGRVTTINNAAEREFGDLFEDIQKLKISLLLRRMNPASRSTFMKALRGILKNNQEGIPFEFEFNLGEQNGSRILQGAFTYLRDSDQKPYGMVLTFENITQKRLIEQQLYHADKLSSIGQLAASVAHEIKNPLASIKTLGQLLQEELAATDTKREYVDVIVSEVNRLNGVVEQLLKFAKPEESKFSLVPISELMKPVIALIHHEMERHNIRLVTQFQENLAIFVDAEKMKQVFLNLIFNAIQAMPEGGEIRFSASRSEGSSWDIIQLGDSGKGIPPDLVSRIFDPFVTTKQRGTGLGLAIVKKIVDLHGGKIEVKSQINQGTTFTISLPAERKDQSST